MTCAPAGRSVTILVLVWAASAQAADLSVPKPYYTPANEFNWTGLYFGFNGGGAWGQTSQSHILSPSGTTGSFAVSGVVVGGTGGFNLQVDHYVFGFEGDLDYAGVKGNSPCAASTSSCTTKSDFLFTGRGRLGFTWNGWLPYVTGGAAFADISQRFTPAAAGNSGTSSDKVGWTVGGGIEVGFWPSFWSLKADYLHVDLGTFNCTLACSGNAHQITSTRLTEDILRLGANYRF